MARFLISLLVIASCSVVHARMYQWVDPDNGTTQLSGKPPTWYRSDSDGPRVFVFENGKLIDDTRMSVSETERDRLRQQALLRAEEDKEKAKEKLLEAKRLQTMLSKETEKESELQQEVAIEEELALPKEKKPATEEETINEMRAIIEEWEKKRVESARGLIGSQRAP